MTDTDSQVWSTGSSRTSATSDEPPDRSRHRSKRVNGRSAPPKNTAKKRRLDSEEDDEDANMSGSLYDGEEELDELQISGDEDSILDVDGADSQDEADVLTRHRQVSPVISFVIY